VGVKIREMEKQGIEMSCLKSEDGSARLCGRSGERKRKRRFGGRRRRRGRKGKGRKKIRGPREILLRSVFVVRFGQSDRMGFDLFS
jgi:hypothetical protein